MEVIYVELAKVRLNGIFPQFSFNFSVTILREIELDLITELIDRSTKMPETGQPKDFERVFHETKFVFLSCAQTKDGKVVHTTIDSNIGEAWAKAPAIHKRETTHIIRCETEILRIKQG